jgi:hypothetical protein
LPPIEEDLIAIPAAATAAAVSAAATTISPAAPPTPGTLDLRTRFIHVQGAPANLGAVQRRNSFLSVFRSCHFDEAKAARASGIPVGHDADSVHLSMCLEQLAQFIFRSVEVEVPNKNVLHAIASE